MNVQEKQIAVKAESTKGQERFLNDKNDFTMTAKVPKVETPLRNREPLERYTEKKKQIWKE